MTQTFRWQLRGFDLSLHRNTLYEDTVEVRIRGSALYTAELSFDSVGSILRIENALKRWERQLLDTRQNLEDSKASLNKCEVAYAVPFQYEDDLQKQLERQAKLNYDLDLNRVDDTVIDEDEERNRNHYRERRRSGNDSCIGRTGQSGAYRTYERGTQRHAEAGGRQLEAVHPFADNAVLICNEEAN